MAWNPTLANVSQDLRVNFVIRKFISAALISIPAQMVQNVAIILHIIVASASPVSMASIAQTILMIAKITYAKMVAPALTASTIMFANVQKILLANIVRVTTWSQ